MKTETGKGGLRGDRFCGSEKGVENESEGLGGGLSPDFRHKEESNKKPVKSEPYSVYLFTHN